jgi:hypothetical protein
MVEVGGKSVTLVAEMQELAGDRLKTQGFHTLGVF